MSERENKKMNILIKGMEMPKSGDLTIVITSSGYVEDLSGNVIEGVKAISVPTPLYQLKILSNAPTIIPAEEGEP